MLQRPLIVSAVSAIGVLLTATLLAGCGIRGPLTMPQQPSRPTPPTVPDPGMHALPGGPAAPAPNANSTR